MLDLAQLEILFRSHNQSTQFIYCPVWNLHKKQVKCFNTKLESYWILCYLLLEALAIFVCASIILRLNDENHFLSSKRWLILTRLWDTDIL